MTRQFSAKKGHDFRLIQNSNNQEYPTTQAGLQASIDALPAAGGWVSGPGMHTIINISTPITIPDNVKIMHLNLYLADGSDCDILQNSDQVGGNTSIRVENCYLDGNKANNALGSGINFTPAEDTTVKQVTVVNPQVVGIFIDGTSLEWNNRIVDCYVYGSETNTGIRLEHSRGAIIQGCESRNNFLDGIELVICYGGIVIGCQAWLNTRDGIHSESATEADITGCVAAFNRHGFNIGGTTGGVNISGCSAFGNNQHGYYVSNVAALHCQFVGCYGSDNSEATVNTYDNFHTIAPGTIIAACEMSSGAEYHSRHGIFINGVDDCIINGCSIHTHDTDGIHIEGACGTIITSNRIVGNAAYGITIDAASTHNSIEANYTSGNATACLRINNVNCINNIITNNQFDEGNISDVGGAHNCKAWLNYDPSANAFILAINPPVTSDAATLP